MHVRVVTRTIKLLGLPANVERLLVNHVNVEQERQVVICVRVLVVEQDTSLQVLHRVLVISNFEVGQAQIVVQLWVVVLDPLGLLKRRDRQDELLLLVHGDAVVEEGLPGGSQVFLQVSLALDRQGVPVVRIQEAQADLFKLNLLFHVPFLLARRFIIIVILFIARSFFFIALAIVSAGRDVQIVVVRLDAGHVISGVVVCFPDFVGEDVPAFVVFAVASTALRRATWVLYELIHVELTKMLAAGPEAAICIFVRKVILVLLECLVHLLVAFCAQSAAHAIREFVFHSFLHGRALDPLAVHSEAGLAISWPRMSNFSRLRRVGTLLLAIGLFLLELHGHALGAHRCQIAVALLGFLGIAIVALSFPLFAVLVSFLHLFFFRFD